MHPLLLRLAKALLRLAIDQALEKSLPKVFDRIDAEMPVLLANQAPPVKVTGLIASAIADATGKRATKAQLEAVIGLYNPVAAAVRNISR